MMVKTERRAEERVRRYMKYLFVLVDLFVDLLWCRRGLDFRGYEEQQRA